MSKERELLEQQARAVDELARRRKYNQLNYYQPYPKQAEFHAAGADYSERCLGAGNQLGKTLSGSFEVAMHATGKYPDWWAGVRFDDPVVWWVGGHTGETIRDTTQKLLVGRIQDLQDIGAGAIPKDCILDLKRAQGIPDALDHVKVKHISGGTSLLFFKSYEKGRLKWQGETIDGVWFDEEPPADIYSEGKTRTNKGQHGQMTMLTYTPLLGMTDISHEFYQNPRPSQHLTNMTIDDVEHYTDEEKANIVAGYPEHEREARAKGIPVLGSGRVFPVAESQIVQEPFPIPMHYARIMGCDFGWAHPQAFVDLAWDRDLDIVYVVREYRMAERTPAEACSALRHWAIDVNGPEPWPMPVAWPHDGHDKRKNGIEHAQQYAHEGLKMLGTHATHADVGGYGTEPGIMAMLERMRAQKFKVFSTCGMWFEEFRLYHRKDGEIVKERDDLMSATRIGCMMLRYAEVPDQNYGYEDYGNDRQRDVGSMGY